MYCVFPTLYKHLFIGFFYILPLDIIFIIIFESG